MKRIDFLRNMKLRNKLIVVFIVITIIPLVCLIVLYYSQAYSSISRFANLEMKNLSNITDDTVSSLMLDWLKYSRTFSILGGSFAVCLSVLCFIFIYKDIMEPIIALKDAMIRVRKGNLNVNIPFVSKDEIGQVICNFNMLTDGLKKSKMVIEKKTEEIEEVDKKLQKLEKVKNEFVSRVSHELRGPLTSIRGYAVTMLNGKLGELTEIQKDKVARINQQGKRLQHLIDNWLNLSRLVSRKVDFYIEFISLHEIIKPVLSKQREFAEEKNITIEIDIPEDLPNIEGDVENLQCVFTNILNNAIKFSPEGSKVILKGTTSSEANYIGFSVQDSGYGIAQENLKKIFDEFYCTCTVDTRPSEGAGIGLAIVKHIIEAHKGHIRAESDGTGKGTKIIFLLPKRQK